MTPLSPERIATIQAAREASRLPDNKWCYQCGNYLKHCRVVLAGQEPFGGISQYCYYGNQFDKPFGLNSTPEQLAAIRAYRGTGR